MTEEFNLSEKIVKHPSGLLWIDFEDVKEFIKRLKKECFICGKCFGRNRRKYPKYPLCSTCIDLFRHHRINEIIKRNKSKINQLAGDKLK